MESAVDYIYESTGAIPGSAKLEKDSESNKVKNPNPKKITSIIVYWNNHLCGFRAYYDGILAGPRIGKDFNKSLVTSTRMDFDDDEYITQITGKSGDFIEHMIVQTSKGRSQTFGSSQAGEYFILKQEGMVVQNFDIGYDMSLNFIGVNFGAPVGIFTLSRVAGTIHKGSTEEFDDLKDKLQGRSGIEISSIDVFYDENMIVGIDVIYKLDGLFMEKTSHRGSTYNPSTEKKTIEVGKNYIVGIRGRASDDIDSLTFTLKNGDTETLGGTGGSPFANLVQEGKKVVALKGGNRDFLDALYCYYQ